MEKLEAWFDSEVDSEEKMSLTLVGPELEKAEKLTKDRTDNEEKNGRV